MSGLSNEQLAALRTSLCEQIAGRIERDYFAGVPTADGLYICALLTAAGFVQTEPGTKREETIDRWLKMLCAQIERLQAAKDQQR